MHHQNVTVCCLINYSVNKVLLTSLQLQKFKSWKTFNVKIPTLIKMPDRKAALLQLHLHSRLNTWLQCIGQRQLQDKTRNIFSAAYSRDFTVFNIRCFVGLFDSWWEIMSMISFKYFHHCTCVSTLCFVSSEYKALWQYNGHVPRGFARYYRPFYMAQSVWKAFAGLHAQWRDNIWRMSLEITELTYKQVLANKSSHRRRL